MINTFTTTEYSQNTSIFNLPLEGCKYCGKYVYLSVYLLAQFKNHTANFNKFIVHVVYICNSALLWRCCNMLCTSGFVDDITFSHNGHRTR